jgi:hypothetical protein
MVSMADENPNLLFDAATPLGFSVRVGTRHWDVVTTIKHPVMLGKDEAVREVLEKPEEVRQSRSDPNVYLFYRLEGPDRWTCAVAKRLNGDGFLITAYPTDAIKEGTTVWPE